MPKPNNGPQLGLNKAGTYEIRWTENRRSNRKSTGTSNLAEAQSALGRFLLARAEVNKTNASSVDSLLDSYLKEHVAHKVVSKLRQELCVGLLRKGLGSYDVEQLTPEVMLDYQASRRSGKLNGNKVGDGTLRRELNCLIAAINHGVKHRRIKPSQVPHIDLPMAPPPKDLWLNEDELSQFINIAATFNTDRLSRIYRFVVIASETAARKTSILTLRWSQVDLESGLINFQNDGTYRTKKRRVAVPMSDLLKDTLLKAWAERTQNEWVLDTPASIQKHFDALKKRVYLQTKNKHIQDITPHTLRHTWATLAARAGVPLFEIAGVLGDTLTTVMKVYAHHCPDHLRNAVNFRARNARNGDGSKPAMDNNEKQVIDFAAGRVG